MRSWSLLLALLLASPAYGQMSESAPNIAGATDGTKIGNVGDRFKVDSAPAANVLSTANSTSSTLGAAGVFTGTFEDILSYADVAIIIKASHAGTLVVQWSSDGTNVDDSDTYSAAADFGTSYTFGANARYVRVVYTNGATPQSYFRLQTIYHRVRGKPSSHRIEDSIVGDNDAELVKSVLTVRSPDGTYRNVPGDDDGNLIITALTGFGADFAFGDVTTAASTTVPVRRTTYTEQTTNAQRSFSSSDVDDDGSPLDTGARTIRLTYLDASGNGPFTEDLTLNGTTCVATVSTTIAFIEQIDVLTVGSTGANEGTISLFVNAACGGGTIGTIAVGNNQTFWAHHYVPVGKEANITGLSVSHSGTTVGSGAVFSFKSLAIGVTGAVEIQSGDFHRLYGQSSNTPRTYTSPVKISGPARIVVYVTPETTSSTVYRASLDFFQP